MNDRIESLGDSAIADLEGSVPSPESFQEQMGQRRARQRRARMAFTAVPVFALVGATVMFVSSGGTERTEANNAPAETAETAPQDTSEPPVPEPELPEGVIPTDCGIPYHDPFGPNPDPVQSLWMNMNGFEVFFGEQSVSQVETVDDGIYQREYQKVGSDGGASNYGVAFGPKVFVQWPADTTTVPEPGRELGLAVGDEGSFEVRFAEPGPYDYESGFLLGNLITLNDSFVTAGACTTMSVTFEADGVVYGPLVIDYTDVVPSKGAASVTLDDDPSLVPLCDDPSYPNEVEQLDVDSATTPEQAFGNVAESEGFVVEESSYGSEGFQKVELSTDETVKLFRWDYVYYKVELQDGVWQATEKTTPGC